MRTPPEVPLAPVTGLVVATHSSRRGQRPVRQMVVRTDDGRRLTGSIPISIRATATTLTGRRISFHARVDEETGRFCHAKDATILALGHPRPAKPADPVTRPLIR